MTPVDGKTVLVTGGTGSFGNMFVSTVLKTTDVKKVIVLSRDEMKQWEMRDRFRSENRIRFFIGDVRDFGRLRRAFQGVDIVIHAAALKHVPVAEYNPFEAVKTNIHGAQNVIDAAIDCGVKAVIALSTDKASSPTNLYGATKLVSDKLFVDGNAYAGGRQTRFSVVRYGNVLGSRGSVVPFFRSQLANGGNVLPITDERMTRFWITLPQGVQFVLNSLELMRGGEIFVPKIPSMRVVDLARAMAPNAELRIVGIRPGEKLHEELISEHDARRTVDLDSCYSIEPDMEWIIERDARGRPLPVDFRYTSDTNRDWMSVEQLEALLANV
jgi:UDP-N-acetylglucosamine 4,6-dehydratase/5-epimerase